MYTETFSTEKPIQDTQELFEVSQNCSILRTRGSSCCDGYFRLDSIQLLIIKGLARVLN